MVIGVLLGSTITLTLSRPPASTAEVIACTNKSSGVVRLLTRGRCDSSNELEYLVRDLQSILPTSSVLPTTTTGTRVPQKFVVDSTGKTLGQLTKEDGFSSFIVRTKAGIWSFGISYPRISGFLYKIGLYFDSKCQRPYLAGFLQPDKLLHTAVDDEQKSFGYMASTGPLPMPTKAWVIQTTRDPATEVIQETRCVQWNEGESLEVETGAQFFKSVKVPLISYTPPLKIVEK